MLSLSKNVKIFYFRNEKKLNEVAKMYRRNESSFCEIVKKEKEISASLLRQRQREKPHSHNFHYNILFQLFYFISYWQYLAMTNLQIKFTHKHVCIGKTQYLYIRRVWYYTWFQGSFGVIRTCLPWIMGTTVCDICWKCIHPSMIPRSVQSITGKFPLP